MVYNNLGRLYSYWKKEEKSIYYYKKAFKMAIQFNKQSLASESGTYLIEKSKSNKTKEQYRKKYMNLHSDNQNATIDDYIIMNCGNIEYETMKRLYLTNCEMLNKKHRVLHYAKLYYKFIKFLKLHKDDDFNKYIEKIPTIVSQLSNSVIKKRLVKIYDINTKISRSNRT